MREFFYLTLGFLLLVAQTTLLASFPWLGGILSPILVLIVYIALFQGGLRHMWIAAVLGYLVDIFSGSPFGFHMVLLTAVYLFTTLPRGRVFLEGLFFQGVAVAVAVLIQAALAGVLFDMLNLSRPPGFPYEDLIGRMLFNGVIAVMFFGPLQKVDEKISALNNRRGAGISLD